MKTFFKSAFFLNLMIIIVFGLLTGFAIFAGQPNAAVLCSTIVIIFSILLSFCSVDS